MKLDSLGCLGTGAMSGIYQAVTILLQGHTNCRGTYIPMDLFPVHNIIVYIFFSIILYYITP